MSSDCGLFSMSVLAGEFAGDFTAREWRDSAHCLNFDSLWYSVYEVSQPQIFYDITVRLRTPDDYESGWRNVTYSETTMTLSQQQPVVASAGGQLRAELVGDLATAVAPQRFESKYLAVPSRPAGHERVDASQPLRTAMLLDRSLFDLSGRTCDKIGVSFTAFRYQPEACNRPAGSCLFSQLEDFYLQDLARAQSGQSPMYMVDGFCEGGMELAPGSGGQIFLACPLAQRHTTLLRLEARADEAMFVTNVASGRIVSAEVAAFQALAENGEAEVMMLNTGAILADFTLGLSCASGLAAGPAVQVSLKPLESASRTIQLFASGDGSGRFYCNATLFDAVGDVADSVNLEVNVTSLQRQDGAQGGADGGGDTNLKAAITGGTCATTCPSFFDVMCFLAHGCWESMGYLALAVVLLLVLGYA
ncbi:unnamed protein product, partial [Effrenium voratum]